MTLKIFVTCFACIHLPLIAAVAYLSFGFALDTKSILILLTAATLVGTVSCLVILNIYLRPLRAMASALRAHQPGGAPWSPSCPGREDEIGVLSDAIDAMTRDMGATVKRLSRQALSDDMTGLGNRRWLTERLEEEIAKAGRSGKPLSVVLFDLDNFKSINDRHGHDVGDSVLVATGEVLRTCLRSFDIAARIGGEEFCMVLPDTPLDEGWQIAERVRKAMENLRLEPLARGGITASFGVSETRGTEWLRDVFKRADEALYSAKAAGRNRTLRARPAEQRSPMAGTDKVQYPEA
ncbi:GGDEF domain-containing protein [Rhizobium sp. PAMB 3182]